MTPPPHVNLATFFTVSSGLLSTFVASTFHLCFHVLAADTRFGKTKLTTIRRRVHKFFHSFIQVILIIEHTTTKIGEKQ